jgi:hypothetical protein
MVFQSYSSISVCIVSSLLLFVLNNTRAALKPKIAKTSLLTGKFFLFPTLDKSHKLLPDSFLSFPVPYIFNKFRKQSNSNGRLQPQLILYRK